VAIKRGLLDKVKELKRKCNIEEDLQEQRERSLSIIGRALNNTAYANQDEYMHMVHPMGGLWKDEYMKYPEIRDQIL